MSALDQLRNRIDLVNIPFTERDTRLLLFRRADNTLSIRLTERWERWQKEYGHYRQRPPIVDGLTFFDANGSPLPIQTDTFPHVAHIRTEVGSFSWVFEDAETLMIRLPAGRYGIGFDVQAERALTDRRGGMLHGVRNVAYTTNARLIVNEISSPSGQTVRVRLTLEADEGMALLLNITPRLAYNRSIPSPDKTIDEAKASWEAWFAAAPPVAEQYREQYYYAWWVMRIGLLATRYFFTREALVPSKVHYVGVWQWDQFFHALAFRHVDAKLAEDQIRILLDHQQPNGMLPDAIHDEGLVTHLTQPVDADVTKPPLLAWAVLKMYEKSGHLDFLQEVYEPIIHWHEWWLNYNRNENGLCEYRHPFSSGLDDSPLWDAGMPVVAPDLNTYLYIHCRSIARIAELIGEQDTADMYRASAEEFSQGMLDILWNPERGIFDAQHEGQPIAALTPFNLLPVWIDTLPEAVTNRLIAHLTDPATFWPNWPLPSVAVSDPHFDPMQMWRGPTWVNVNYLFVEALTHIERRDIARRLRQKTLELMMQHPDIYEYYHPLTAERPPKAAPIFGWSSAVFIDLAIQESAALAAGI